MSMEVDVTKMDPSKLKESGLFGELDATKFKRFKELEKNLVADGYKEKK